MEKKENAFYKQLQKIKTNLTLPYALRIDEKTTRRGSNYEHPTIR